MLERRQTTASVNVPAVWINCHGHMSDAYYLLTMSEAISPFFEIIG